MKANNITLEKDLLHELFDYEGGNLVWRTAPARNVKDGDIAGCVLNSGYRQININKTRYQAHRLMWIYHNGSISKDVEIDHINRDTGDNRIENLRIVSRQENQFNRNAKGYTKRPSGRYEARIKMNQKLIHLGMFDTEQEAKQAYLDAKKGLHIIKERVA